MEPPTVNLASIKWNQVTREEIIRIYCFDKRLRVAKLFSCSLICNLCNVYSTIDFQITWIYKNCNIQFTTMLRSFKVEFWEVLFIFFVINQKYIFHLSNTYFLIALSPKSLSGGQNLGIYGRDLEIGYQQQKSIQFL